MSAFESNSTFSLLLATEYMSHHISDGGQRLNITVCQHNQLHLIVRIPANPEYAALNLAQAALLVLYELRMAANLPHSAAPPVQPGATHEHLERLFRVSEEALRGIGFFKYNPTAVMHTLRQIVYRAEVSGDEAALLLAIARQVTRRTGNRSSSDESTEE